MEAVAVIQRRGHSAEVAQPALGLAQFFCGISYEHRGNNNPQKDHGKPH
jgi:hypothetical protein